MMQTAPELTSGITVAPWLQIAALALAALGIAFGIVKRYFKDQPAVTPVVPALDERTARDLCSAIDRLDNTLRSLSSDADRSADAMRDNTDAMKKLRTTLGAAAAMPRDEEMLMMLRRLVQLREGENGT